MSTVTKVLIGVAVIVVIFGVSIIGTVIGVNNQCVRHEQNILAQYKQNQNNYDNFFKKVREIAQVPDMYVADLEKVYNSAMKGRYGDKGSVAVFQWIQENNPTVDSSIYKQIQQVIEAGRNSFEANQKMLLDKKRVYELVLNEFPSNIITKVLGFPKVNLKDIDIVTSEETENTFKNKKSDPLNIR